MREIGLSGSHRKQIDMLWVYKHGFRGWAQIFQWSFFEHEITILNTNANKHCNDLGLAYKSPTAGHQVSRLYSWGRNYSVI